MSKRIQELEEAIIYHNDLYTNAQPEISDAEYDKLVKELRDLDPHNPVLLEVGATPSYGKKVKHDIIMGSLNKATYDKENGVSELNKFFKDYTENKVWTWKIDGLAVELVYNNGIFIQGSTRGDGEIGSDVTDNIKMIQSIPKKISKFEKLGEVIIRGEIYLPISIFKKEFATRNPPMKNPRNAAAGILSQEDPIETGKAGLKFFAYKVFINKEELTNLSDEAMTLKDTGLEYVTLHVTTNSYNKMLLDYDYLEKLDIERKSFDFQTDGIVIIIDDRDVRNSYGMTGKNLKAAIAWKFRPEESETIVKNIEWNVGRSGVITPVAILSPVELAGTTVTRATLHNIAEMKRLGVGIGSTILIHKGGDIIPKITQVIDNKCINIVGPLYCPTCNSETIDDGIKIMCVNSNCPAKIVANIIHYLDVLDIKDVGEATIELMYESEMIRNVSDLYQVTPEMLITLPRMGKRSSKIIVDAINSIKEISLAKFLTSLGITNLGETVGKQLSEKFKTLDNVLNATAADFNGISGIGHIMSKSIYEGLKSKFDEINKLRSILMINDNVVVEGKLTGKSFCITGTLSKPRKYFEDIITKNGGNVTSVKSGLSYLLVGEDAGSKLEKAKKLGISIIDENQFMSLI